MISVQSGFTCLLFVACLLPFACTEKNNNDAVEFVEPSAARNKISTHIRKLAGELENGERSVSGADRNLPGSGIVRVDSTGSIHCYVHMSDISQANLDLLETIVTRTEIVNMDLKIAQCWIHFSDILSVAKLPFVKSITPPEYGKTL